MINMLSGALSRTRAAAGALMVTVLLALTGCQGTSVDPGKAPSGKDVANKGGEAADTAFDKVTDWGTSYPKLIAGLVVFVLVMVFGRGIIGNSKVRVLLGFIAGVVIAMALMR
jgi:hypothetical protein